MTRSSMTVEEKAGAFVTALGKLCTICEVPTLAEYGVDMEMFRNSMDKMADDALASGSPQNTAKRVSKEDIIRIYKSVS